jgi:hypothetical protein
MSMRRPYAWLLPSPPRDVLLLPLLLLLLLL